MNPMWHPMNLTRLLVWFVALLYSVCCASLAPRAARRVSARFAVPQWLSRGDSTLPTALVTGAGSGIGRATASQLAALGFHVVVAARTLPAARCVADEIRAEHPGASVEARGVDLRDVGSVATMCASLASPEARGLRPPLRLVVNAAGMMSARWRRTDEGVEETAAVNAMAPARLASGLIPRTLLGAPGVRGAGEEARGVRGNSEGVRDGKGVEESGGGEGGGEVLRMVTVGSFTHRGVTRSELQRWMRCVAPSWSRTEAPCLSPASVYACSKTAAGMHASYAHRLWSSHGFSAVVADPGLVDTAINREWPRALRVMYILGSRLIGLLVPAKVGAAAVLHACFMEHPSSSSNHAEGEGAGLLKKGEGADTEVQDMGMAITGTGVAQGMEVPYVYGAHGVQLAPSRVASDTVLQEEVWTFLSAFISQ